LLTGRIKFRSRKRVYQQQPSRVTRSKKIIAQSEASLKPSGIHVPSPAQPDASEDDGLALHDENIHMITEGDSIPQHDGHNHMANEGDPLVLSFY
jgi:hypothetical protein